MRQESQKWKVPGKLTLDQGRDISFTGIFCQFRSIVVVLVLSLVACSTLSEVVGPLLFDNNVNVDNGVDDSRDTSYPSNLNNDEASRIVIVGANGGLLTNSDGIFHKEDHPPRYELYWDYNVATELLAYASSEYHAPPEGTWSVSDFWSFDYQNNVAMRWWSSGVGRVSWDPSSNFTNSRAALLVFNEDHDDFSLGVATSPGRVRMLADHVGHAFSWSPDGTEIAFVRQSIDPGLYVLNVEHSHVRKVSDFSYKSIISIFDEPLWIVNHNILAVADSGDRPLLFVRLHDTSEFVPTTTDGHTIPGPRPDQMLWSPNDNQLVISGDSGVTMETWIHSFESNMYAVNKSVNLGKAYLAGWYEYGVSVILVRPDGTEIYTLPNS